MQTSLVNKRGYLHLIKGQPMGADMMCETKLMLSKYLLSFVKAHACCNNTFSLGLVCLGFCRENIAK